MANGEPDQDPNEEDRQKYDLYSEEEEQEILAKMDELALAGQLDDDSYREILSGYGLTEDDFTPPVNVGGMGDYNDREGYQYDDGYDLGRVPPETGDASASSDSTDYSINETGLSSEEGSGPYGGSNTDVGDISGGDSGGGGGGGRLGGGNAPFDPANQQYGNLPQQILSILGGSILNNTGGFGDNMTEEQLQALFEEMGLQGEQGIQGLQ